MFSAAVKLVLVPSQIMRKQVSWRVLGFMCLGGVPGVLLGTYFLKHLVTHGPQALLNALLGVVLVTLVNNVLILAGIPSTWQTFVVGCFIVLAGTVFAKREPS